MMECQKRTKKFHLIKKEIAQTIIKRMKGLTEAIYGIARSTFVDILKRSFGFN